MDKYVEAVERCHNCERTNEKSCPSISFCEKTIQEHDESVWINAVDCCIQLAESNYWNTIPEFVEAMKKLKSKKNE